MLLNKLQEVYDLPLLSCKKTNPYRFQKKTTKNFIVTGKEKFFLKIMKNADDNRIQNEIRCIAVLQKNNILCSEIIRTKDNKPFFEHEGKKAVLYKNLELEQQKFSNASLQDIEENIQLLKKVGNALQKIDLIKTETKDIFNTKKIVQKIVKAPEKKELTKIYLQSIARIRKLIPKFRKANIHKNFTESNILKKENTLAIVDLYDVQYDYKIFEILIFIQNVLSSENEKIIKKFSSSQKIINHLLNCYKYKEEFNKEEITAIPDVLLIILINNYINALSKYLFPVNKIIASSHKKLIQELLGKSCLQ